MFEVSVQSFFSSAHRLRNYQGKCEALHGHNWKVEIIVHASALNDIGLAMDFKELKNILNDSLAYLDHACLNDLPPFTEKNPSAENIAEHLFGVLREKIKGASVSLAKVSVWESENSRASYFEN
ncbi:MAG: 6-carboxytetrahydropterin synthase QueD [Pseudomonadota bacterium]